MPNKHKFYFPIWARVILVALALAWYPYLSWYQDDRYEREWSAYTAEKAAYDSTEDARVAHLEDSLFAAWPTVNDTALRKVQKITKSYDLREKKNWQKTERTRCSKSEYSSYTECEPVWDWVTVGYESYAVYDTTWTKGYRNRQHWLNTARSSAHNDAMKQRVDFPKYGGFQFHQYIKSEDNLRYVYLVGIMIAVIVCFLPRRKSPQQRMLDIARNVTNPYDAYAALMEIQEEMNRTRESVPIKQEEPKETRKMKLSNIDSDTVGAALILAGLGKYSGFTPEIIKDLQGDPELETEFDSLVRRKAGDEILALSELVKERLEAGVECYRGVKVCIKNEKEAGK